MRARHIGIAVSALIFGLALVLLRGEPRWNGDQGVFLSIAARMLDGDHLYADVIDNKDPLFFYAHAGALWVGGWRGPAALDGLWFALAALSFALLLRELRAPGPAVVAGFFMYPLALTASWYEPGLSMLGGLAIAPFVGWLWLRGRFVASGAVLGTAMLFKISLTLVVVAPLVVFVLLAAPAGSRVRHAAKAALGLLTTMGAVATVLAVRGELRGYLGVLAFNLQYPDDARRVQGASGGIASHLDVVREFFLAAGKWQAPTALLAVAILFVAAYGGRKRGGRAFLLLAAVAIATLIAALGTLALTAIWVHHLQMLAFPAVLIGAVVVSVASISFGRRVGAAAAGACMLFALWSSVKHEVHAGVPARAWSSSRSSVGADSLEEARMRSYESEKHVTYMVFGSNSENAHAVFIDDAFDLACRWFHLYPNNLQEHLSETLDCAEAKTPMLVLVTVGFFEPRDATPEWDSFVSSARRFLNSRYEKVSDRSMFQVWKRRSLPAEG